MRFFFLISPSIPSRESRRDTINDGRETWTPGADNRQSMGDFTMSWAYQFCEPFDLAVRRWRRFCFIVFRTLRENCVVCREMIRDFAWKKRKIKLKFPRNPSTFPRTVVSNPIKFKLCKYLFHFQLRSSALDYLCCYHTKNPSETFWERHERTST